MSIPRQPAAEERPPSLLDSSARPLENVEDLLMRARVGLAELKRTWGRSGLPELQADATKLKSEVEQLARRRRAGHDKSSLWNSHSS
jgi:hypothetical protein